jgi:hypothetical protein
MLINDIDQTCSSQDSKCLKARDIKKKENSITKRKGDYLIIASSHQIFQKIYIIPTQNLRKF